MIQNLEIILEQCRNLEIQVESIKQTNQQRKLKLEQKRQECLDAGFNPDNLEAEMAEREGKALEVEEQLLKVMEKLQATIDLYHGNNS